MIKRFENFEQKMDYDDLIYILQDFEDEEVILDKLLWKMLCDGRFVNSIKLNKDNFTMTHGNGFILIMMNITKGYNIVPPLQAFANRIKEHGWKILQYSFADNPAKIVICKIDDKEMIQKSLRSKLI